MIINLLTGHYTVTEIIYYSLIMFLALMLSFSVHEFMHCFVATKLGDDTAYNMGRYTLNPLVHIDPRGLLCMILIGFGWGKPVPVNTGRLTKIKNRKLAAILVYLAGVGGNFVLALISNIIANIIYGFWGGDNPVVEALTYVLIYTTEFSLMLLGFNLLVFPPLDGFNVLQELLPLKAKMSDVFRMFVQYSPMILMVLILIGCFTNFNILSYLVNIIEYPFRALINFITEAICSLIW